MNSERDNGSSRKIEFCPEAINKSFLNREGDRLDNLIKTIRSTIVNMKDFERKHNMDFFKGLLGDDMTDYMNFITYNLNDDNIKRFKAAMSDLYNDVDKDLIRAMKLDSLRDDLDTVFDHNKSFDVSMITLRNVFTAYINGIDKTVNDAYAKFVSKSKLNRSYDVLTKYINKSSIDEDEFSKRKYLSKIELLEFQEWVKENNKRILVIFEGRDAAGKSSMVKFISEHLDPKNCRVLREIKRTNDIDEWFEFFGDQMPKNKEIVLMDRSWYNKAVVEPVMGYCTEREYDKFMRDVNNFEDELIKDGTVIIKIWLAISRETQKLRFELRKNDPLKYWKYSENDKKIENRWKDVTDYVNRMFKHTNTISCPWNIINSDDKKKSRLESVHVILEKSGYLMQRDLNGKPPAISQSDIMFLDIDGPMIPYDVHTQKIHEYFNEDYKWNKISVSLINELIRCTGLKVVISSSYRKAYTLNQIEDKMKNEGFKYSLMDETPDIKDLPRKDEILKWINSHNVRNFIIIDDVENKDISDYFPRNFIMVDHKKGFSIKDFKKSIKIMLNI